MENPRTDEWQAQAVYYIACIQRHHALPTLSVTHPFTERLTTWVVDDAVCRLFDICFFSGRSGNSQYSSAIRFERIVKGFFVIEDQHFVAPRFVAKGLFSRFHHNKQTRMTKHPRSRLVARLQTNVTCDHSLLTSRRCFRRHHTSRLPALGSCTLLGNFMTGHDCTAQ